MKKALSLLLVAVFIIGMIPTIGLAANETYDEEFIKSNYNELKGKIDKVGYIPKTGNKTLGGKYETSSYYLEHHADTDKLEFNLFQTIGEYKDYGQVTIVPNFEETSEMLVEINYISSDNSMFFTASATIDAHLVTKDTKFSFMITDVKNIPSSTAIQNLSNSLYGLSIVCWEWLMEQVGMSLSQIGFRLRCGEHVFTEVKTTPAACITAGEKIERCAYCGLLRNETIPANGTHSYIDKVLPATMTADGAKEIICSVCGEVKSSAPIAQIKTVMLSKSTYIYDGKTKKPYVVVKDRNGKTIAKENYSVKYDAGRKAIGMYNVIITFKGDYEGTVVLPFKIVPGKVTELKGTGRELTWSAVNGAQKYVVYCSANKTSGYKKIGTTAKLAYSLKKLETGKTYYFKVRALTKVNGSSYYGGYSSALKLKMK